VILIKTKKEIDFIRESCKIVAETLQLVKSKIKIGVTTKELDLIAEDYIRSNNAIPAFKGYSQGNGVKFPASLCTSVNNEVVHGIPGNYELKDGDLISIDVGVLKNNFYGDAAISVGVGKVSEIKQKLMEVTERSLYIGIDQAKESNKLQDISFAIQSYVESNGFSVVRDLCGHGVGKYLHEDPSIPNYGKKGVGPILRKGMTLAIEPMVNVGDWKIIVASDGWTIKTADGTDSAHFEHTILITDKEPEILTVC
jgi:methionyl aminopeptidase